MIATENTSSGNEQPSMKVWGGMIGLAILIILIGALITGNDEVQDRNNATSTDTTATTSRTDDTL